MCLHVPHADGTPWLRIREGQAREQGACLASRKLLARCLASHLQGEPHGSEPPFLQASFESTSPHHHRDRDGQLQASQTASWGGHGLDELSQRCTHDNVCLRLDTLMRIPDVAWVPFSQSHSNILDLDLDLACAAVLDSCSRPPRFLDESYFATRRPPSVQRSKGR